MATNVKLELAGKSPEFIYQKLTDVGLKSSEAAVLIGSWIYENFGKSQRTFDYHTDFPDTDPNCASTFARTFQHKDWADGESVVQASQTAFEDGFNLRLHRIESDLDSLNTNLKRAFACVAEMRTALRHALDELRAEINRINNDVYLCCQRDRTTVPGVSAMYGSLVENATFVGTSTVADKVVSLWKTDRGIMMLPAMHSVDIDLGTDERLQRPGQVSRLFEENPAIGQAFPQGAVTKRALVGKFGGLLSTTGRTLQDLVRILPEAASYNNLAALVDDLTEREASALRTTAGVNAAVAQAFGLEPGNQRIETAKIDQFTVVPAEMRAALLRQGIETIGKLAATEPKAVVEAARAAGLSGITTAHAQEWTTSAKTLAKLD